MHATSRSIIFFLAGVLTFIILLWLTILTPPGPETILASILFLLLLLVMSLVGIPLGGGTASFLPMATITAFLVVGLVPAGWIAFACELLAPWLEQIHLIQVRKTRRTKFFETFSRAAANAAIQPASILFAGAIYQRVGGLHPLQTVQPALMLPLFVLGISYLAINYVLAGLFFVSRGRDSLGQYLLAIQGLLAYEGVPILFAPLMALIYSRLGIASFVLLSVAMVASALIMRNLAQARLRLERRVRELDSLQAVGKAVGSSLELNIIMETIYQQICRLMPAENCFIALYDKETDQVSFPFVIEEGARIQGDSRKSGEGLTEYILRTSSPVLAVENTNTTRRMLGLVPSGKPAASWLGVPIIAGDETLGVIALQSYRAAGIYDRAHQSVLLAIAAQAAIAIKNARLYARTDEALAWRVQQLSSILEATHDGILLLNLGGHIITANPAFAALVGVQLEDLLQASVNTRLGADQLSIAQRLGYGEGELQADYQDLIGGEEEFRKQLIVIPGTGVHLERTIQPVRDQVGAVDGWLLVLRDMSEEVKLEQLRDDLVQMIIHDLRSPLTIIQNGYEVVQSSLLSGQLGSANYVLEMIGRSTGRMLSLINQMLDIRQLESAELELHPQPVSVQSLIQDLLEQFGPAILDADIQISLELPAILPEMNVDPDHAGRIFSNLLDNAIKFTPNGGRIVFRAQYGPTLGKARLIVSITDSGRGISPEMLPHLFQKLKTNSSQPARRRGSGLGLYYCKLAVEAHHGCIWVESEFGQGSTFFVALPSVDQV
jgi:NtrC-family two-component system sensor histidine kinase KinB